MEKYERYLVKTIEYHRENMAHWRKLKDNEEISEQFRNDYSGYYERSLGCFLSFQSALARFQRIKNG